LPSKVGVKFRFGEVQDWVIVGSGPSFI